MPRITKRGLEAKPDLDIREIVRIMQGDRKI